MSSTDRICAPCAEEGFLCALIGSSPITDQPCNFCGNVRATITLGELADHCDRVLEDYFTVTSLSEDVLVRGEDPGGDPLRDVLDSLRIGASVEVRNAVAETLTDLWFDPSSNEHRYGEEPYFVESSNHAYAYGTEWRDMERSLKTEARLVNPKVSATLKKVFGPIRTHQTWDGDEAIVPLGDGTGTDTLYRARVFQELESLERALYHPAREVGPPPPGVGRAGRMNAQGVSVFYGATRLEIAVAEVRPPVGSHVLLGTFKIVRRLTVLDLDKLEQLAVDARASFFDPSTKEIVERVQFLRSLSRRMLMPVMPDHESSGYLITQAIADFLATDPQLNLDGILFKSVQFREEGEDDGRNVVLFNKASRVAHADQGERSRVVDVELFETDEDGEYWSPNITLASIQNTEPPRTWFREPDKREVSLDIDLGQLGISEVQGVTFQTNDMHVRSYTRPD